MPRGLLPVDDLIFGMCWLRVDIRSEHGCEDLGVFLVLFKRPVVLALLRIHVANFFISVKHIKVLPTKQHDPCTMIESFLVLNKSICVLVLLSVENITIIGRHSYL